MEILWLVPIFFLLFALYKSKGKANEPIKRTKKEIIFIVLLIVIFISVFAGLFYLKSKQTNERRFHACLGQCPCDAGSPTRDFCTDQGLNERLKCIRKCEEKYSLSIYEF